MRGAWLSIGSTPYIFTDLCQELETASIPGGVSFPRQPNKPVQRAPRWCRASLHTAQRVPSPNLVSGQALSDGAPSSRWLRRNALSQRTAPQLLEAPRTPRKSIKRHKVTPCGMPSQSLRVATGEPFLPIRKVYANCRSQCSPLPDLDNRA